MANLSAELNQFFKGKVLRTWLGFVKSCDKKNATRVEVPKFELDENLYAFFKERTEYFAFDPEKKAQVGDTVLIRELENKKTSLITHELLRVVYLRGDITDPITGRKVMNETYSKPRFRDEEEKLISVYGPSPNRFIYEKAPPRGWQAGKRDLTDKKVSTQFHDDGTHDPYKVNLRRNFAKPEYQWPK